MRQIKSRLDSQKKHKKSTIRRSRRSSEDLTATGKKLNVGAIGDRATKKDSNNGQQDQKLQFKEAVKDNMAPRRIRPLNFPTSKYMGDIPIFGNNEHSSSYNNRGINILNKHGIAKTCIRPPSANLLLAQKQERNKSPTPPPAPPPPALLLPALSPTEQKTIDFNDYFNINTKLGLLQNSTSLADNRSKIRDNIRRNRSFKAINSNDLILEENNFTNFNGRSYYSVLDQYFNNTGSKNRTVGSCGGNKSNSTSSINKDQPTSVSVNNLIENFSSAVNLGTNNKLSCESLINSNSSSTNSICGDLTETSFGGAISADLIESGGGNVRNNLSTSYFDYSTTEAAGAPSLIIKKDLMAAGEMNLNGPKLSSCFSNYGSAKNTNSIYENKLYVDRQQQNSFGRGPEKRPCSGEYQIENSNNISNAAMDSWYYKMTSEGKLMIFFYHFCVPNTVYRG